MSLDRVHLVRRRLIVLVVGGPAASIVCGIACAVVGEIGLARHYDSPWPTFLEFLGVWSFIIGCLGLFSYRARGYASDGMQLRALLFWKPEATQLIASYALSTLRGSSLFPPDYFQRWFRLASARTRLQGENYYENWLSYTSAQETPIAAQFLERCLADSARMDDDQRDPLVAEAVVFTAWRRNDAKKADVWSKRIQSPDRLNPLAAMRVRIAMLCAHEDFDAAISELNRALALIQDQPATAQRQKCETEWVNWREQVQQRSLTTVAT